MACTQEKRELLDAYLDEELTLLEAKQLEAHIYECESCEQHLQELKRSVAIIQSASHFEAPRHFTEGVMNRLPEQPARTKWKHRIRRNPLIVAAAAFLLVFVMSMAGGMGDGQEMVVEGEGQFLLDREQNLVIIPEGSTVDGDLTIRNGDIEINGEVTGTVTVVNGQHLQASASGAAGEIEEINDALEQIWFQVRSFTADLIPSGSDEE
ncbi:zf-HC2 domain-containing protein [Alkalicoccus chagannorensis]|uniref:zf-HC2 domain-containing protein n=1 Tax=Alkalicoccus chagannorensis TaxID=427072 RepID=UPI0003F70256|nr:zf-HC2 domain-containing protein [Alkalicoccus chagannorensis]